jgi:hypothetical protein
LTETSTLLSENAWKKKLRFDPTSLNPLREMPFFNKNIKILIKKRLEALREMPFFDKNINILVNKMLGRKKLRFDPTSLNLLCEIV